MSPLSWLRKFFTTDTRRRTRAALSVTMIAICSVASTPIPVAYAQPKEGRNSWVGLYGISPKCQTPDLAEAFLDEKLTPQVGVNLIRAFAYGHVNPNAYAGVTDTNIVKALALRDPTALDRTRFTPIVSEQDRNNFGQLWARVKAAH